tara:strand:- start:601 stop:717 length:117 start_codon:yes stop_codon:yes gene_type:complete
MWKGILKVAFWGTVGLSTGLIGIGLLAADEPVRSRKLE